MGGAGRGGTGRGGEVGAGRFGRVESGTGPGQAIRARTGGYVFLFRGIGFVARRPRLWPLGLLPAVVTFVLLLTAVVVLAIFVGDLVAWVTPFADDWSQRVRQIFRIAIAVAVVALGVWVAVLTFVALTLLLGQPFYEKLSKSVDEELGDAPQEPDEAWHRGLRRSLGETLATIVRTLPAALCVFLVGLIPVVGQVVAFLLGALVGGRFLALELLAPAMERRGRYLRDRLALVKANRAHCYEFGVPAYLLFLVPVLNVLLMPGAVVGATLLVRELVDERERRA